MRTVFSHDLQPQCLNRRLVPPVGLVLSTVPNKRTACVTSREVDVHHEHQSLLQRLDIALVHVRILVLNDAYLQQLPRLRDVWLLDITRALLPRQNPGVQ